MKECITHHHACDCREAEFAGWKERAEKAEARCAELSAAVAKLEAEVNRTGDVHTQKLELRAERSEALLREAFKYSACLAGICVEPWRAKVRDLLEGKNDKG